jgi:hypothetical protein
LACYTRSDLTPAAYVPGFFLSEIYQQTLTPGD